MTEQVKIHIDIVGPAGIGKTLVAPYIKQSLLSGNPWTALQRPCEVIVDCYSFQTEQDDEAGDFEFQFKMDLC